ncbi:hypothetical protein B0H15DRAFT_1022166 [Mycena belliarum]|uniref:Secreted protein n=1 Tax=Mycena belliarum TaxID=1033014 RepID=A0AAD6U5A2_9AGAR|nr:hypothetical protein B0H15DRAFT_1022166 [Mycena belliae]
MRSIGFFALSFISVVLADKNTTIDDTDASIQYSGGGHELPCLFGPDGTFLPGQPGCFNSGPKNCSSGAHLLKQPTEQPTSSLSMVFKGSAVYMNVLLSNISNVYTVTLDGKATDVDGFRPQGPLLCDTLFSQTGLDPTKEHNISLSIKGLSPSLNTTSTEKIFSFWLDNFVVTTPDNSGSSAAASQTAGGSGSAKPTNGVVSQLAATSPWIAFGLSAVHTLILGV